MIDQFTTGILHFARSIGETFGRQLVVELSSHSIEISMEKPNDTDRAWDDDLYTDGQVFYKGYANPIKVVVRDAPEFQQKDEVDVVESKQDVTETSTDVISSSRYRDFMRQNLISQLMNPKQQWRLLVYGVIGIAALQFFGIIVTLYATGSF